VAGFDDELPPGPFDLAVSALAVHHLEAPAKQALFRRLWPLAARGGGSCSPTSSYRRNRRTPSHRSAMDSTTDTALAQVAWLRDADFEARVAWEHNDLALLVADLR